MLQQLTLRNFIIFDELSLDLRAGFSAFTGETGAGKSIFVDAIGYLCGDRIKDNIIQQGHESALIEACFDFTDNPQAMKVLQEAGFEVEENTIVTREITPTKSTFRLNHRIVTLSLCKELLQYEIDIHSQHETQYLLDSKKQITLLDEYLEADELLRQVEQQYQVASSLKKQMEETLNQVYNESDLEFFQYQLQEIEQANLKLGEDEKLEQREKEIQSFQKNYTTIQSILHGFNHDEGVQAQLYALVKDLETIDNERAQRVRSHYYELCDEMEELQKQSDAFQTGEDEINEIQERLFEIQKLKRKYGFTLESILEKAESLRLQINQIEHRQAYLDEMQVKVEQAFDIYRTSAVKLHEVRIKKAKQLEQAVAKQCQDLMLPHARFEIRIEEATASKQGIDHVEFFVSMNPGEPLKPLSRVASGGELSRLMLALKVLFTALAGIRVVIFDEIDTGVSGVVATAIGRKMKELSKTCQVLCVTHLAQVASCSDAHYFVAKTQGKDSTQTSMRKLDEAERIEQMALMATGSTSDSAKESAAELLRENQKSFA